MGREIHSGVMPEVALSLLGRLSGFRGYPREESGLAVFCEALERCVSVDHARAVVNSFDGEFPTLRELKDCVYSQKQKFAPDPDPRDQWEGEYWQPGKGDPEFAKALEGIDAEWGAAALEKQRTRDELHRRAKVQLGVPNLRDVSYPKIVAALTEAGFPHTEYERELMEAWARG